MTIDAEDDGRRIDNFLHSELPDVPRGRLYRLVRRGEVRVDGARVRAGRRLRAGEAVRIPPVAAAGPDEPARQAAPGRGLRLEERILYEDDRLLVLNKPAGLAVHGGSGVSFGVIELLRAARPRAPCLELVHRLDRDTSGCLIVAKRRSALRALHEALRGRVLDKRYVALLRGSPTGGRQRVDLPLDRGQPSGGERRVRVSHAGRESVTELAPIASGPEATLAEALPRTGRTHQIRVHCAALGHPIAGDERYGDEAFNLRLRRAGLRRLFLHAARVRIEEPGRPPVVVRAPLDPELIAFASRLGLPRPALVPYGPRPGSESIRAGGRTPSLPSGGRPVRRPGRRTRSDAERTAPGGAPSAAPGSPATREARPAPFAADYDPGGRTAAPRAAVRITGRGPKRSTR